MSRIQKLFERKHKKVFNIYFTAGYPGLHSTVEVMSALARNGADMIEVGMPYSDPLADGPVIQASSSVAIANGMTIDLLFQQLKEFRRSKEFDAMPVVLMGYLNPVMQYGFERFCKDAAAAGVDGLILPDLPLHEFQTTYKEIVTKYKLDFTFLITPETSGERIKMLDAASTGFLYAVSSSSTTGKPDSTLNRSYLERLVSAELRNPVLVGFGINGRKEFEEVCRYMNGAIIGSAFIRSLKDGVPIENSVKQFMQGVLKE